ncbi:homologous recombination OB-fold protein isoform X2 [Motacilla alba alba]|uniref:homologous recombination OB-fold protein isoform X2 n=1 Tax=Motacilla alba alba TaxID=1094192 RepID=UPI0018D561A3|nr:homologous recombination OB-fold protein isoform X2 [Motacilla alba alba]
MSCHFQKLFGTDEELEDEDFLSAVQDAENQFVTPGCSSPSVVPVPPREPHPREPHPSKAHPSKPPTLRPLAGQGEHPVGFQGPSWRGAAPQDEQDNDLLLAACRELEGPEVPVGAGTAPVPPRHREKPPWKCPGKENAQECGVPKKLRVGEELVPGSGGLQDRQNPLPGPKLVLRPSAAGACAPRGSPSTGEPGSSGGSVPAPGAPCLRPVQAPLGRGSSSVPWTPPAQSCPQPRLPPRPPGFPNPPTAPSAPGPPNAPVVTNHLVQLVTAASKAPRGAPRAPARRESRRFPGPAGILPQQHSGKLLEEILVSAPQTPAHGAVAKPRAQALSSSPLPSEEDFGKGPWLAMKTELGLDERDPGCFLHTYSVVMVLRKAALKQLPKNKVPSMAVMIKTLTRSSAGAGAVFRDPTGEMQGTVHRLLLEQRQSELRAGSVLLLRQSPPGVSLFLSTGDSRGQVDTVQSRILGASPCAHRALIPAGKSWWRMMDVTWMTWTGSWESCLRISSQPRLRLTVAEPSRG